LISRRWLASCSRLSVVPSADLAILRHSTRQESDERHMDEKVGDAGFEGRGSSFRRRGEVYRWLRKNHEAVKEWLVRSEPAWAAVAARIASEGVIGTKGAPRTGNAARRVWQRVCRDIAAERQRDAERAEEERSREIERLTGVPARKQFPRDFPQDWSPPVAERRDPASHSRDLVPPSSSAVTRSEQGPLEGSGQGKRGLPGTIVRALERLEGLSGRGPKLSAAELAEKQRKRRELRQRREGEDG
jgi:hypothetical protein